MPKFIKVNDTHRTMIRTFFIILLAFPVYILAQPNSTIRAFKAEKLFAQGRALYDNGDFRGAIDIFDQVADLNPDHQTVFEIRGEAFYKLEKYEEALEDYSIAARQHPQNAEIKNSQGVAAAKLGQFRAARSYFYDALQINPDHEHARRNLDIATRKLREMGDSAGYDDYPSVTGYPRNPVQPGRNDYQEDSWIFDKNDSGSTITGGGTRDNPVEKPSVPLERTYSSDQILIGDRTDPYVTIERIKINQNGTQVTFSVQSVSNEVFPIKLDKVGGPNAFYITDRDYKRIYNLINIRSLPGWPNKPYELTPSNPKKYFTAEFERLDDDVVFFHILEGKQNREGSWDFWDVEIRD